MSLATRCTACGTVFRVVQDQLKVSEGWVRCGRCNDVFNALEALFDLERDAPPDWPIGASTSAPAPLAAPEHVDPAGADASTAPVTAPSAAPPWPEAPASAPAAIDLDASKLPDIDLAESEPPDIDLDASPAQVEKIDSQLLGLRELRHDFTPANRVSERDRLEFPDAQFDTDMLVEDDTTLPLDPPAAPPPPRDTDDSGPAVEDSDAPGFVRHAQQRERWQSPGMRGVQAFAIVVLLAVLGLQAGHQFRDLIAARWPEAAPALAAWCGAVGCRIEAPRRIDDVAVESSALTRATLPDAFRLAVVLRNRGTLTVALPSVDLSLTDAAGKLVARRMLAPRDFRVASTLMRPGAEAALQLVLSTGDARVTGYTVEVFYP